MPAAPILAAVAVTLNKKFILVLMYYLEKRCRTPERKYTLKENCTFTPDSG
jgi:hypothetical protein